MQDWKRRGYRTGRPLKGLTAQYIRKKSLFHVEQHDSVPEWESSRLTLTGHAGPREKRHVCNTPVGPVPMGVASSSLE